MLSIEEVLLKPNLFHIKTIILFLNYLLFCWSDKMHFNKAVIMMGGAICWGFQICAKDKNVGVPETGSP